MHTIVCFVLRMMAVKMFEFTLCKADKLLQGIMLQERVRKIFENGRCQLTLEFKQCI